MAGPALLFEKYQGVATFTLNRPERGNAFDQVLVSDITLALESVERDAEVRAVVITGAGKHFCAGQDLAAMSDGNQSPGGINYGEHLRATYNPIISRIRTLDKPVIGAINGAAAGAGLGLACACDLRHASTNAKFRMAFIGIGLAPDSGTSFFLPRLIGMGRALEMALTNDLVDASRALEYGLVNRVFTPEELMPRTMEFAVKMAQAPTRGIGLTKRAINLGISADLETVLENEAELQQAAGHTADHLEGVLAFIEKRTPQFKGT